jgi:hypothetical protein
MENHFVKPASAYKRDLDVLGNYRRDMALFLSRRTGKPVEDCKAYVLRVTGPGGKFEITDPTLLCINRGKNGDRGQYETTFTQYLKDILEQRWLFAPSMTVYEHPDVLPSLLSEYITGNIVGRGKVKHEGLEAKMAGQEFKLKAAEFLASGDTVQARFMNRQAATMEELEDLKENEQTTYKIANNSLSGGQASASTILHNKSAHSSLTSTCRVATSLGNANNEKFLAGNRHYWAPDVVKANIVSIIGHVDYDLIAKAMDLYGFRAPTVDETMQLIAYSTQHYWTNRRQMEEIRALVEGLNDHERAAFAYVGDMWHLAKYNDVPMRVFMARLSQKATVPIELEEAKTFIKGMDNDLKAFVSLLCSDELSGLGLGKLLEQNPHNYCLIGATVKNIHSVLNDYQWLIKAFWVTDNMPASIAWIRDSVRQVAITSDTDSTIFTVQNWVEWYTGKVDFSPESFAVDYTMVYLATQSIIHVLAMLSTTLGVVPEKLNVLAMKNEFAFSVFSLTSMAKHYYAYKAAKEGNVFTELEEEIKGVYLKDSNCPPNIMKEVTATMCGVMDCVMAGEKIKITPIMQKIADIEHGIVASVMRGESLYLARASVKDAGAYVNPGQSPYQHYLLWERVFSGKYGEAPKPPYSAIKVSLDLPNKTALGQWIEGIQDPNIKMQLMTTYRDKTNATTLLLPKDVVEQVGLPTEVLSAMNIRKLVYSTVRPFYLILESLGVFLSNDNNTKLVSDFVPASVAA